MEGMPNHLIRSTAERGSLMRRFAAALVSVLVLSMTLPSVAAADPAQVNAYAERVDFAGAVWFNETQTETYTLEIHVFDLDDRSTEFGPTNFKDPGVELFYTRREMNPATGEVTETDYEGFSGGAGANFRFQRSLDGAMASLPLRVFGWQCIYPPDGGAAGISEAIECHDLGETTVDVAIVWTGVGPIVRDRDNSRYAEPSEAMFGAHIVTSLRDARANGTISGGTLQLASGTASYAVLLRGKYHEQWVAPRPTP